MCILFLGEVEMWRSLRVVSGMLYQGRGFIRDNFDGWCLLEEAMDLPLLCHKEP
jgi:hypothetical protein